MTEVDLTKSVEPWPLSLKLRRGLWRLTWSVFGRHGPRALSPLRIALLRAFGAEIGERVLMSGGVAVLMPWNLRIGNCVAVAEGVNFYNFATITVGDQTSISQNAMLCTGTHDYSHPHHPLIWKPISIGRQVWLCASCFIAPGVAVGDGAVVAACAVVVKNVESWTVNGGNPSRFIRPRTIKAIAG